MQLSAPLSLLLGGDQLNFLGQMVAIIRKEEGKVAWTTASDLEEQPLSRVH